MFCCRRKAPRNIPPAAHLRAVHQLTGCPPSDVLAAQWVAHLHRPAWYAAVDRQRSMVVVCIRGTLQARPGSQPQALLLHRGWAGGETLRRPVC